MLNELKEQIADLMYDVAVEVHDDPKFPISKEYLKQHFEEDVDEILKNVILFEKF
jgi:hypothetical protein